MLLFADGELAGLDAEKFAVKLACRKPAAEFVAKQIRLAQAENRDVIPLLSALAEAPYLRDDFLAKWTRYYAADFLRHMGNELCEKRVSATLRVARRCRSSTAAQLVLPTALCNYKSPDHTQSRQSKIR